MSERTTCEECDARGWETLQSLHGVDGRTLCWTHAQQAINGELKMNDKPTTRPPGATASTVRDVMATPDTMTAVNQIVAALAPLDDAARRRVLHYVNERLLGIKWQGEKCNG